MPDEKLIFPEWFTDEMKEACVGMTQAEVDAQDVVMKQQGCVPPVNCPNCTNTGCFTPFRDMMIANNEAGEIG